MKINRRIIGELPGVYAVASAQLGGSKQILAASELPGGQCRLIDPDSASNVRVWDGPGGTMSLVPVASNRFFAVQQFYAGFKAGASIVVEAVQPSPGEPWTVTEQLKLPFLHRLAAIGGAGGDLLACTLCGSKRHVDDWDDPGAVYRLSRSAGTGSWQKVPLLERVRRNHGLGFATLAGKRVALIGTMDGLFSLQLPQGDHQDWTSRLVLEADVSDAAAIDWDGDGMEELVTIEPFHGNRFVFYKQGAGGWQRMHEIPCQLGHSLWAGRALGRPLLILGERMGEGQIQVVFPTGENPRQWQVVKCDAGTGGTNVTVREASSECLEFVSANTDNNQVVHYSLTQ